MVCENERAIDFEFLRKLPKYILISVVSQGGLHAYLPKTQFLYSTRPFEIHGHFFFFFKDVFIEASRYIMFFQPSTVIFRKC